MEEGKTNEDFGEKVEQRVNGKRGWMSWQREGRNNGKELRREKWRRRRWKSSMAERIDNEKR